MLKISFLLLISWSTSLANGHPFGEWIHLALFFSGVAFFVWVLMEASESYSR